MSNGSLWVEFDRRLGDSWADLATVLAIPTHDLDRFVAGHRARAIRNWLDERNNLLALTPALVAIGRYDLAELVAPAIAAPQGPAPDRPASVEPQGETRPSRWWTAASKRTRRRVAVTIALVVVAAATVTVVLWQTSRPRCGSVPTSGTVDVTPSQAKGLVFCPVAVNDGRLPIVGPFSLSGQVLGDIDATKDLELFVYIDRQTCDTSGKRGSPGRFFIPNIVIDPIDRTWSHFDDLGGQASGVTLGRIFEFAIVPENVRQSIIATQSQWNEDGLTQEMLDGVTFLAKFVVPPGDAPSRAPCRD